MGDIRCRVCGEPWDAYGVRHHEDMTPKEAKAFLMGLGCPCCKGVRPEDYDPDEEFMNFLYDVTDPINDDGDPIEAIDRVSDASAKRLTWKDVVGDDD